MAISQPASARGRAFDLDLPGRLVRLLDAAAKSHGRAVLLLVIVALVAFLPGFAALSPIDRDESRFAQATKQMLESGNYIDIRFHVQARHKKPVGIHWLQAASVKAGEAVMGPSARTSIFLYRVPSLLAAIGAVLLTYWTALVFLSRRGALLAALLMATCVLMGVEARLAKTDAVLLFTILAAMGALARAYALTRPGGLVPATGAALAWSGEGASPFRLAAIFWTAMAAGILVKGPMTPLFVGLPVLTLMIADRSVGFIRLLNPLAGILWCLLLVLPWFVAIYYVTNGAFYQHAVGVDMLGKVTEGQEGHGAPPGTYLAAVWGTFWPAVALAPLAVPFAWRARREGAVRFLLAWLVPTWLLFEIAATKLPHYVLPLYPAIAILIALAMERGALAKAGSRLAGFVWLWPILAFLLAVVGGVGFVWLGGGFGLAAWPALLVAVGLAFHAARAFSRTGPEGAFLTAGLSALFLYFAVWHAMLPNMQGLWISQRLAAIAREQGCPASGIASLPYQEPSLVFLVGTDIHFVAPREAVALLKQGGCKLAFIGSSLQGLFERQAAAQGLAYSAVATVEGFTYNGGRPIAITVYRPAEPAR